VQRVVSILIKYRKRCLCCYIDKKESAQVSAININLSKTISNTKLVEDKTSSHKITSVIKIEDTHAMKNNDIKEELKLAKEQKDLLSKKEIHEIAEEAVKTNKTKEGINVNKLLNETFSNKRDKMRIDQSFYLKGVKEELSKTDPNLKLNKILKCKLNVAEEHDDNNEEIVNKIRVRSQASPYLNNSDRVKMAGSGITFLERIYQL